MYWPRCLRLVSGHLYSFARYVAAVVVAAFAVVDDIDVRTQYQLLSKACQPIISGKAGYIR